MVTGGALDGRPDSGYRQPTGPVWGSTKSTMKKHSIGRRVLGWVLGVAGTAITALIVSLLVPYISGNLPGVWLPAATQFAQQYLTYPVPAWSILAAVVGILVLRWLFRAVAHRANPDAELFAYTTDTFGPWHFHWNWTRDRYGRRTIRNLSPICSVHDATLKVVGSGLVCPKCRRVFPPLDRTSLDHFRQTIARKAAARYGVEV